MHHTALPSSFGVKLRRRLDQATAGGGDDQLHALQAALPEVAQEASPALQIFLLSLAFGDAQDLSETFGSDADRHQHADIAYFPCPAAFEHHAIEVDVGEIP